MGIPSCAHQYGSQRNIRFRVGLDSVCGLVSGVFGVGFGLVPGLVQGCLGICHETTAQDAAVAEGWDYRRRMAWPSTLHKATVTESDPSRGHETLSVLAHGCLSALFTNRGVAFFADTRTRVEALATG